MCHLKGGGGVHVFTKESEYSERAKCHPYINKKKDM